MCDDAVDWELDGYQFSAGCGELFYMEDLDDFVNFEFRWNKPNDILEIILYSDERELQLIVNGRQSDVICDNIERRG